MEHEHKRKNRLSANEIRKDDQWALVMGYFPIHFGNEAVTSLDMSSDSWAYLKLISILE